MKKYIRSSSSIYHSFLNGKFADGCSLSQVNDIIDGMQAAGLSDSDAKELKEWASKTWDAMNDKATRSSITATDNLHSGYIKDIADFDFETGHHIEGYREFCKIVTADGYEPSYKMYQLYLECLDEAAANSEYMEVKY